MSVSGNVIVAPVSIDDVRRVLGDSSTDEGTLCKSSRINALAKHKPVPYNKLFPSGNEHVQGMNNDYSLSKPSQFAVAQLYSKGSTIGDNIFSNDRALTYIHPNGGLTQPYRLPDFNGYDHKADFSNSGLGQKLFRINIFGISENKAYINNSMGIGLQFASKAKNGILNFYEVMTDGNLSVYPSLLFQLPAATQSETDYISKGGFVYKIISAPYTLAQMSSGAVNLGYPYNIQAVSGGTTYNLGSFILGSEYYYSISINLSNSVFQNYINKNIKILPCFTSDRFYFKLQNENSASHFFALPNVILGGSGTSNLDDAECSFTLKGSGSSPTVTIPPKISILEISPTSFVFTSSGSITINYIKFRFTNQSSGFLSASIKITTLQIAVYGKNNSGAVVGMSSQSPTTVINSNDNINIMLSSSSYNGTTDYNITNSTERPLTANRHYTSGFSKYAVGIYISITDPVSGKTNSGTFYYDIA